jgi:hypothetical protein
MATHLARPERDARAPARVSYMAMTSTTNHDRWRAMSRRSYDGVRRGDCGSMSCQCPVGDLLLQVKPLI